MTPTSQRGSFRTIALAVATTALVASSSLALADPPGAWNNDQHNTDQHNNVQQHAGWGQDYGATQHTWRSGDRIGQQDWNNAPPVDYRAHHLRRPPHGYAWRESNGQFVLAAVATGLIASIILDGGR